ncbi:MAG: hypothetical protein ABIW83_01955 [Allosphingosinicella sp.]
MVAAQHKLSRRALLVGACAVPVLPLSRHCEERSDAAIQRWASTVGAAGLPRCARNDGKGPDDAKGRDDGRWQEALARFRQADQEVEALVHCRNQRVYDRALGRHSTALSRLLRTPAPDLAAAAEKLELIVRHHVFEARFGEAALAVLHKDMSRLAAPASQPLGHMQSPVVQTATRARSGRTKIAARV